jgi:hypothetical protein
MQSFFKWNGDFASIFKLCDFTLPFRTERRAYPIPWNSVNGVNFWINKQVFPCDFTPVLLENFVILSLFQDYCFDIFGRDVDNKIRHIYAFFYFYKFGQKLQNFIKFRQTQFIIIKPLEGSCSHQDGHAPTWCAASRRG